MKVSKGAPVNPDSECILEKILHSFERYYNIQRQSLPSPFSAIAEFHSHSEQYFLIKPAHIADIDSHEYVFFAEAASLDENQLNQLAEKAWEEGLSRIHPASGHRNSDITLIILASKIEDAAFNLVKKIKKSKSYKLSFWGWSNFRALAYESSTGSFATNRMGRDLKKLISSL